MRISRSALVFLTFVWVAVVLYPDPGVFVRSLRNSLQLRVDPSAAAELAARLPDDPRLVEAYVLERQVPYAYDWQSAGVPWYFPSATEALAARRGDCESRAMVLASVLTAKGIPNELRMSIGHIWVDYPGKRINASENAGLEIAGRREGRPFLRLPQDFDPRREIAEQLAIHWAPAPMERVLLLFAGVTLIPLWNVLAGVGARGRPLAEQGRRSAGGPARPATGSSPRRDRRSGSRGLAVRRTRRDPG